MLTIPILGNLEERSGFYSFFSRLLLFLLIALGVMIAFTGVSMAATRSFVLTVARVAHTGAHRVAVRFDRLHTAFRACVAFALAACRSTDCLPGYNRGTRYFIFAWTRRFGNQPYAFTRLLGNVTYTRTGKGGWVIE